MFDQSYWKEKKKPINLLPKTGRKGEKHFNAEYKKNTRQAWPSFCLMPLLTKKNTKGWLEYAKSHLDRPAFWKNVLWSDMICGMPGAKTAKFMSRRTPSTWSNMEEVEILNL